MTKTATAKKAAAAKTIAKLNAALAKGDTKAVHAIAAAAPETKAMHQKVLATNAPVPQEAQPQAKPGKDKPKVKAKKNPNA